MINKARLGGMQNTQPIKVKPPKIHSKPLPSVKPLPSAGMRPVRPMAGITRR
jgi:hypothetical protein